MKIRFLDEALTKAVVSRRKWPYFWVVEEAEFAADEYGDWYYTANGCMAPFIEFGWRINARKYEIVCQRRATAMTEYLATQPEPWKRV